MLAPEVQWLQELLEQEEWGKVLKVAPQLLLRGGFSVADLAEINYAISRSRAYTQDLFGAIPAGLLARKLALDNGYYDLFARATLVLGVCYIRTRQYETGRQCLREYLEHLPRYGPARQLAGHVWHNLGMASKATGKPEEALRYFERAKGLYQQSGDVHWQFIVLRTMFECCLDVTLADARSVLQEMRRFIRQSPVGEKQRPEYLWCRARYAQKTGAHRWAAALCVLGLNDANKDLPITFHLNLTLSQSLAAMGESKDALRFALAARLVAIEDKAYDREFLATEAMYNLLSAYGYNLFHELNVEYAERGLDLHPFVGAGILAEGRTVQ